jgi:hypothetical protein
MFTFLTTAKSFLDAFRVVQLRALSNWQKSTPNADMVLFGKSDGAEMVCDELNIRQVPDIEASQTGVPYFDSVARWAEKNAKYDVQVYANADILFPPDFGRYLEKVPMGPFLMVGQRVDLAEKTAFDPDVFYDQLKSVLKEHQAEIHRPSGMDFFVFRRGMFQDLKPLIVGRGGYDSALVAYCLRKRIPVIDASFAFPIVHQWHDYGHLQGGKRQAHAGEEAQLNLGRHGLRNFAPHCVDADLMMLRSGEIVPNARKSWLRQLEIEWYYKRGWKWCPRFNQFWNILTRGGRNIKNPEW